MKPPNPPSKHHYLPEFYTKQWASDDGMIIRFTKVHGDRIHDRRVAPGGIGFERDLYRLPGAQLEEAQKLETDLMSPIDFNAANVMQLLLRGHVPTNNKQRSDWARFLMAFWYRAPEDLRALKAAYGALMTSRFPEVDWSDDERDRYVLAELPGFIDRQKMGDVLVEMRWDLVDLTNAKHSVLTSDQPVLRSNGLKPPEGNYSIPLSPKLIFVASWGGEQLLRFNSASASQKARIANGILVKRARRFVLSNSLNQRGFIEKHFGSDPVPTPIQSVLQEYTSALPGTL